MNNEDKLYNLKIWQTRASIFAAVAVPIIVAIFGVLIQSQISSNSIKKDFVAMALEIIKAPSDEQSSEMRQWAIEMLNSNSPIPFSSNAKLSLLENSPIYIGIQVPTYPDKMRQGGKPEICQPSCTESSDALLKKHNKIIDDLLDKGASSEELSIALISFTKEMQSRYVELSYIADLSRLHGEFCEEIYSTLPNKKLEDIQIKPDIK